MVTGNVCDADLDNSWPWVNLSDFSLFRAAFGQSPANADADFNGDSAVNLSDFSIFQVRNLDQCRGHRVAVTPIHSLYQQQRVE